MLNKTPVIFFIFGLVIWVAGWIGDLFFGGDGNLLIYGLVVMFVGHLLQDH